MSVSAPRSRPSLIDSIRVQLRVIHALMIRQGQAHYTQETLGFFWVIMEPLILTCGVILLWAVTNREGHHAGVNVFILAVTGYSHLQLWRQGVLSSLHITMDEPWMFYHRNITIVDLVFANVCMKSISVFTSFVILATTCVLFGLIEPIRDPGLVLAAWCLDTLFVLSFAVLMAGFAGLSEYVSKLLHPAMYITLPVTGAFVMADWLPPSMKAIVNWVPLANCCEMFRAGVLPLSVKTYWSVPLIVLSSLFLLAIGLPILDYVRKHAQPH